MKEYRKGVKATELVVGKIYSDISTYFMDALFVRYKGEGKLEYVYGDDVFFYPTTELYADEAEKDMFYELNFEDFKLLNDNGVL